SARMPSPIWPADSMRACVRASSRSAALGSSKAHEPEGSVCQHAGRLQHELTDQDGTEAKQQRACDSVDLVDARIGEPVPYAPDQRRQQNPPAEAACDDGGHNSERVDRRLHLNEAGNTAKDGKQA